MEYQKIINLLGNTKNQPYKFRTKNWVEINDDAREMYNAKNQIKFKTSMLRSTIKKLYLKIVLHLLIAYRDR